MKIDLNLLDEQRVVINDLIITGNLSNAEIEALSGVINLLDAISDALNDDENISLEKSEQ